MPRRFTAVAAVALVLIAASVATLLSGQAASSVEIPETAAERDFAPKAWSERATDAVQVTLLDDGIEPVRLVVASGTSVRWRNGGERLHNVRGAGLLSPALDPDDSFQARFDRPGEFRYICALHPESMRGSVIVR